MTSCELDYRLEPNNLQYEDDSEDEESRLQIVEIPPQGKPALFKSISTGALPSNMYTEAVDFIGYSRDSRQPHSSGSSLDSQGEETKYEYTNNATDAVESLLLLGQRPVFAPRNDTIIPKFEIKEIKPSLDGSGDQRLMVNYYQKMRERNNEASKRCRLKRRIKQDSLEKTKLLLESHKEALANRMAKLRHIKEILSDACRAIGNGDRACDCNKFLSLVRSSNREMPDLLDFSSSKLIKKSKLVRETNIEEILGEQAANQLNDLKPLKRGPRKQDEKIELSDPQAVDLILEDKASSPVAALDLSTPSVEKSPSEVEAPTPIIVNNGVQISKLPCFPPLKTNVVLKTEPTNRGSLPTINLLPKTSLVSLAPKQSSTSTMPVVSGITDVINKLTKTAPARKIIVDNPNALQGAQIIPTTPITFGPPSTISLGPSNTIILTPLTHFTPVNQTLSMDTKSEIKIKAEPDISLVEVDTEVKTEPIKSEPTEETVVAAEIDPTKSCCAKTISTETSCSSDLIDLNSLTQTLDLMSLEPKMAGELTAAEKYIIKSRLSIEFWKAEESAAFICSAHREHILKSSNLQACSVCGKRRSKKLDMYFITYRMAVEFYMTAGKFLSIGLLACSCCKAKSLKGLDFGNSYILPYDGKHPLDVCIPEKELKEEDMGIDFDIQNEDRTRGVKREAMDTTSQAVAVKRRFMENSAIQEVVIPRNISIQTKQATEVSPIELTTTNSTSNFVEKMPLEIKETKIEGTNEIPLRLVGKIDGPSSTPTPEAVTATKDAIIKLLNTLAPGQEQCLWHQVRSELDFKYK